MKNLQINGFGLACVRREGGKFEPRDFLYFNGRLPFKNEYTLAELEEHKLSGHTDEDYADAFHDQQQEGLQTGVGLGTFQEEESGEGQGTT